MMTEEHGMPPINRSPGHGRRSTTFLAFVLCGSVPILAYAVRPRRDPLPVGPRPR